MPKKNNKKRADGRVQISVYIGTENGKRKYKYVYGATQKEAEAKADQIRVALGKGLELSARNDTFGAWLNYWLDYKKTLVSARHFVTINSLSKHLAPLAGYKLNKINPVDLQAIINNCTHLSRKTLQEIVHVADGVFTYAIKNRAIEFNPAQYIDIPNSARRKEERRALTESEQRAVLHVNHRAQTAAMLMLFCGLRRGEVIPLMWSDIDLASKTLKVNKAVTFVSNQPILKNETKTQAGMRTVVIPQILAEYLAQLPKTGVLVCPSASDGMITDTIWKRMWASYQKAIADYLAPLIYPPFTAHCLRHTYATNLVMSGVDVATAKELLGHSNVQTTLNIYTHVTEAHKQKNIDKFNDYFAKFA